MMLAVLRDLLKFDKVLQETNSCSMRTISFMRQTQNKRQRVRSMNIISTLFTGIVWCLILYFQNRRGFCRLTAMIVIIKYFT